MLIRKNDNRGNKTYEVAASFDEMTDWYTDSLPSSAAPDSISSCIKVMQLRTAVSFYPCFHIDE